MCCFKPPGAIFVRAGERPLDVTKQLALQQALAQCPAVDPHKWAARTRTQFVDRTRDQFLARAGFPGQKHCGQTTGHPPGQPIHLQHRRAASDHTFQLATVGAPGNIGRFPLTPGHPAQPPATHLASVNAPPTASLSSNTVDMLSRKYYFCRDSMRFLEHPEAAIPAKTSQLSHPACGSIQMPARTTPLPTNQAGIGERRESHSQSHPHTVARPGRISPRTKVGEAILRKFRPIQKAGQGQGDAPK